MASSGSYDRERAKRYKKWWARQKGSPQGELIQVSGDTWQRKKQRPPGEGEVEGVKDGSAKG